MGDITLMRIGEVGAVSESLHVANPVRRKRMRTVWQVLFYATVACIVAIGPAVSHAQTPSCAPAAPPKYSPDVPAKITTPDTVETRIGTLRFKDGAPDPATVQLAYDQLNFGRGIDAFLRGMSATSVHAICRGLEEAGAKVNQGIVITADLMDARSLFLTPNTTTVYRHLLALALECSLGGEDLLGEMLRSVGVRGREACGGRRRRPEPGAAAAAELVVGFVGEAAGAADDSQRGPTLRAETPSAAVV